MRISRGGAFVGGIVCTVVIGTGTAVAGTSVGLLGGRGNVEKATTGLTNTKGTPLSLVAKKGTAPLKVSNTVKVKNLDSDLLDGKDASAFLGAGGTAADSAKLGGQPASSYTTTVYSAATTTDQPAVPLVPPTQIDAMTLPPGTWSLSLTANFENSDAKIGQFGCFPLNGVAPNVTAFDETTVDVMATNAVQTTTYATLATSAVISLTKATPFFVLCVTIAPHAANGSVVSSNLTATRVTDFHGSVTVLN